MKGSTKIVCAMSFLYGHCDSAQASRVMCGGKWISAGDDGMSKMIHLYST